MDKTEVEQRCVGNIEKIGEQTWKLRNQHTIVSPGLYPYFDSREIYLYFSDSKLVAIIERGSYNVYP